MAQEVAHSVARSAYPQGFAADYWNEGELRAWAKLKQPSGLFVGSMADVFGAWVPRENIQQIIDAGGSLPQHVFQLLTKNAPRLLDFDYPPNFWIGASVAPSQIFGKTLTAQQQERMVRRTIQVLKQIKTTVKWMSVEPLSTPTDNKDVRLVCSARINNPIPQPRCARYCCARGFRGGP